MQDRYLYKAKRLDNGKWVEGALFDGENYCVIGHQIKFSPYIENECKIVGYIVDRDTVCQCTGCKNKIGTLIWEHDVIQYEIYFGIVVFKEGAFEIKWIDNSYNLREDIYFWATERNIAVVGNKFDNPELLEELVE